MGKGNVTGIAATQAGQQSIASAMQQPNTTMQNTTPPAAPTGAPTQVSAQPGVMSIDEFKRSPLMGPTTQEVRTPIEFEGGMHDPELVRRYEQYRSGQTQTPMSQQLPPWAQGAVNQRAMAFNLPMYNRPVQYPAYQSYPAYQPYQMPYQMPYQQQMYQPYQMPYRQPMYQPMMQPYQQNVQPNMLGGLASLLGGMRGGLF